MLAPQYVSPAARGEGCGPWVVRQLTWRQGLQSMPAWPRGLQRTGIIADADAWAGGFVALEVGFAGGGVAAAAGFAVVAQPNRRADAVAASLARGAVCVLITLLAPVIDAAQQASPTARVVAHNVACMHAQAGKGAGGAVGVELLPYSAAAGGPIAATPQLLHRPGQAQVGAARWQQDAVLEQPLKDRVRVQPCHHPKQPCHQSQAIPAHSPVLPTHAPATCSAHRWRSSWWWCVQRW